MNNKLRSNVKGWLPMLLCILPAILIGAGLIFSVGQDNEGRLAGIGAVALPTIACIAGMIGVAALMRRRD